MSWTLAELSPALWLDGADASTVVTDASGNAEEWHDKGSAGLVFTDGSIGKPIYVENQYNGNNALSFDHSAFLVKYTTLLSDTDAFTVFHVVKHLDGSSFNIFRFSDGEAIGRIRNCAGLESLGYRRLDSDAYTNSSYGLDAPSGLTITAHTTDYANGQAYVARDGGEFNNYTSLINPGRTDTTPSLRIYMGASYSGSWSQEFIGDICEVIAFRRVLSAADRQTIEGYLAHKWGLEANLPSDHLYKTSAPQRYTISGVITGSDGNPAARAVRLYDRSTGLFLGETTSDATTGAYEIVTAANGESQRVVLADEGVFYNHIIDRVIPA